jgi:hypothetical protein
MGHILNVIDLLSVLETLGDLCHYWLTLFSDDSRIKIILIIIYVDFVICKMIQIIIF